MGAGLNVFVGDSGPQTHGAEAPRIVQIEGGYDDAHFSYRETAKDQQGDNPRPPIIPSQNPDAQFRLQSRSSDDHAASGIAGAGECPSNGVYPKHYNPASRFSYKEDHHFYSSTQHQDYQMAGDTSQDPERDRISFGESREHGEVTVASDQKACEEEHVGALDGQERMHIQGETQATGDKHRQAQRDNSFYWHSPPSSASISHDRDENQDVPGTSSLLDATPEPQEQHPYAPPKEKEPPIDSEQTSNLYQSTFVPYSASALGFGGPSDWEHFGDYDGEEVDDTDLYIRSSSPEKQKTRTSTSELSADPSRVDVQSEQRLTAFEQRSRASASVAPITSSSEPQTNEEYDGELQDRAQEQDIDSSRQRSVSDQSALRTSSEGQSTLPEEQYATKECDAPPDPPQPLFQHARQQSRHIEGTAEETDPSSAKVPPATSHELRPLSAASLHDDDFPATEHNVQLGERMTEADDSPVSETILSLDTRNREHTEQPSSKPADASSENPDQSRQENLEHIRDTQYFSREGSIKRASLVSDGSVLSKTKVLSDPYADLDPWARSSLSRYIAMLREESRASTDAEKLNLFKAFSKKEWRLRAVLYGVDDEHGDSLSVTSNDGLSQGINSLAFRRPASKALPALPPDADQPEPEIIQDTSLASLKMHKPSLARLLTTKEEKKDPRSSGEESYVMIDTPGGQRQQLPEDELSELYSPGGRPIRTSAINPRKNTARSVPDSSASGPPAPEAATSNEWGSDNKPVYTPFRYSQGYLDESERPVDRRASFRPYAALKLEPVEDRADTGPQVLSESARGTSPTSSAGGHQNREPALSDEQRPSDLKTQVSSPADHRPPADLRRFERADFDPLIAVLPPSGHIPQSAVELSRFQRGIDAVPDDFSFIHQHVVGWDVRAKKIRGEHEKERHVRQAESEQRIDALFNDDEIGYGDIAELESEFKRAEAARKTDEDRAEYQAFVTEVFDVVWTRLHFEIDQLTPLYDEYTSLAHETLAGRDMFEATPEQFALAPTMSALLTLHQKLEIRHQKAFEAVLERDRKLKKTEVSPWYTLGNVAKVKQLEKQFEGAERKAIVEYCKQRDRRANRLMDVLDQNTLRG